MKIAWFCIPAYGHTNPTLGLVKEMTSAGHQVYYFSFEMFREKIEQAGGTATLDIEEKGWHVYQHVPGALARRAMKRLGAHVSQEINGKR